MHYSMFVQSLLVAISIALALASPIAYMVSIARGTSQPHPLTRFALCAVLTLNFCSIYAANGNLGALGLAGIFAIQAYVVFGMSLAFSSYRMRGETLDWICMGIVVIGLIGWQTTGSAIIGIVFSILADAAAYAPALRKTRRDPSSESHWTYTLSIVSVLFGLVAYPISIASAFQFYIIAIDGLMIWYVSPRRPRRQTSAPAVRRRN